MAILATSLVNLSPGLATRFCSNKYTPLYRSAGLLEQVRVATGSMLSKNKITMTLTRLRGCAGWSASLSFTCNKERVSNDLATLIIGGRRI